MIFIFLCNCLPRSLIGSRCEIINGVIRKSIIFLLIYFKKKTDIKFSGVPILNQAVWAFTLFKVHNQRIDII